MDGVVTIVAATLGVAAAWLQFRSRTASRRGAIRDDLEILRALPEGTDAYRELSHHVEERVLNLVREEALARRDWSGIAISCFSVAVAAVALAFATNGGWWLLLLVVAFTFGLTAVVGFAISIPRTVRDAKGNVVPAADPTVTPSR